MTTTDAPDVLVARSLRAPAFARHEMRLLVKDREALIVIFLAPVLSILFAKPIYAPILHAEGYPNANGAEQAVPAMAIFFSFFLSNFAALSVYREHFWGTWPRLLMVTGSRARLSALLLLPWLIVGVIQQSLLFLVGFGFFGLTLSLGDVPQLAVLMMLTVFFSLALAFLLLAVSRSSQQIVALSNASAMILGGLGGALAPVSVLPSFLQHLSPLSPVYWLLRGYDGILLSKEPDLAPSVVMVLVMTFGICVVAVWAFRSRREDHLD